MEYPVTPLARVLDDLPVENISDRLTSELSPRPEPQSLGRLHSGDP